MITLCRWGVTAQSPLLPPVTAARLKSKVNKQKSLKSKVNKQKSLKSKVKHDTIDYRGGGAPGLETLIVYVERCGPRHDEIIIVPITCKRLNTFVLTSHIELLL